MSNNISFVDKMSVDSGLIILGNSGVGKSFLANVLLERDAFSHKFSPGAVTTAMEYQDITFDQHGFTIFNVPGLIEADQTQIDRNKEEIDKAFRKKPNSLILFVFGHQGGRIRNEDVLAFQALNDAYQFNIESLVLVVNNLPKDRPPNYEGTVIVMLKNAIKLNFDKICFLDEINKNSETERAALRNRFLQTIVMLTPREHRKHKDVNLQATSIQGLKDIIDGLQKQFFEYKNLYTDEILRQQQDYDTSIFGAANQILNIGLKLCDRYVNSVSSIIMISMYIHTNSKKTCFTIIYSYLKFCSRTRNFYHNFTFNCKRSYKKTFSGVKNLSNSNLVHHSGTYLD